MFVEMSPVEQTETVGVGREMGRNPIQDHTDARPMQRVDQGHEVLWRAVTAGRGEIAGGLIAPRPVERVLHHRQELDMGETEIDQIVGKLLRKLEIGEMTPVPPPPP